MEAIFTMHSTHCAIKGEEALLAAKVDVRVMPLPSQLGAGCGLCLRVPEDDLPRARALLAEANIEAQGIFWKIPENGGNSYRPIAAERGF